MSEHVKKQLDLDDQTHHVRRRLPGPVSLATVSKRLGGISPTVLKSLAEKHDIRLDHINGSTWVDWRAQRRLRRLPEVRIIIKANKEDLVGRELTMEEMREISETRLGQLPWQDSRR